ncbi:MAG: hypothetical protein JKX81_17495 [Arenicella sp.]|nr:hypothetical protein [Arenicella sp.]
MKKLVVLILVLVGVVFVAKVVVEKRYESALDDAIAFTRGFVEIRYDDIEIGFDSIAINGLSVTPYGRDESVSAASITAKSSDRMFPVKGLKVFENGNFPETFEVDVRQFSAPIEILESDGSDGSYFDFLPKGEECRSFASSFNYAKAGYSRIDADMRVAFDFSDVYNSVVRLEQFDQTSSMTVEWIFNASEVERVFTRQSDQLPIDNITVTYELEPAAAERFVAQCAKVFSVTPEVYLEKVVGSAKYSQNSFGADLGPEMRAALVKFMQGGSQFSLTSKPGPQLKKFEQLQFYKAKDILRWMNLTVFLDGEKIPLTASVLADGRDSENDGKNSAAQQSKPQYFSASASKASSYIGRWVRIKRSNERKSLEGELTGIDERNRLMVEMYRHGGLMTLTVGVDEVEQFQVLSK